METTVRIGRKTALESGKTRSWSLLQKYQGGGSTCHKPNPEKSFVQPDRVSQVKNAKCCEPGKQQENGDQPLDAQSLGGGFGSSVGLRTRCCGLGVVASYRSAIRPGLRDLRPGTALDEILDVDVDDLTRIRIDSPRCSLAETILRIRLTSEVFFFEPECSPLRRRRRV